MSRTYSAGIVTAYGAAVRGGYQGTYEEYCAALADMAATVAELEGMTASASGLPAGSSPTAAYSNGNIAFGIPKGDTGATPDISVGSTETLSPGAPATVTVTGTAEEPVFSFGIPKGEPGDFTAASIAPTFSTGSTYEVGDYVIYDDQLYRCITPVTTAGAWSSANWTAVGVVPDLRTGTLTTAGLHLGFYYDEDGDLCQVE